MVLYAYLLLESDNYFEALYQFRKILWIEPNQFDALFGTANCLFEMKEFEDSKEAFAKVLKEDPYHHTSFSLIGQTLIALSDFPGAIENLAQSLLLDPDNSKTYFR